MIIHCSSESFPNGIHFLCMLVYIDFLRPNPQRSTLSAYISTVDFPDLLQCSPWLHRNRHPNASQTNSPYLSEIRSRPSRSSRLQRPAVSLKMQERSHLQHFLTKLSPRASSRMCPFKLNLQIFPTPDEDCSSPRLSRPVT